jgi:hypothetical protein
VPLITGLLESELYVTTDGQPASLSWNKAPIWGLRPDFIIVWQLRVCWFGAPSLTRGLVSRLQLLLALASAVILGSESRRTRGLILLSHFRDFPFRRLLRLAGSRWRYWTPPSRGYRTTWPEQSRAEQKLTAGNQPARSLLPSGPSGTRGHIFVGCRDLCAFFSPSLILLNDKEEGVGLFFFF